MSNFEKWRNEIEADDAQKLNEEWWNKHPMSYDWDVKHAEEIGSAQYFDEIDKRFYSLLEHIAHPGWPDAIPFYALEDFNLLRGKSVLEIGCGFGSTAEVLSKSGCNLTAIDLTENSVNMCSNRLKQKGLIASVLKMDAENMTFPDNSFDFIWAWGVIHHSFHTEKIVEEMHRVLKPGGRFAVMIYHKNSTRYWVSGVIKKGILGLQLLKKSVDDIQLSMTDGFYARHFTRKEAGSLFGKFHIEKIRTFDMADLVIPFRPLRILLLNVLGSKRYWKLVRKMESYFGWALFIQGAKF